MKKPIDEYPPFDISKLKKGSHIYIMGICGSAMASLAGLLKAKGFFVRGSDQNIYPPMSTQLEELGIEVVEGFSPENLQPAPDLVVVGNVMTFRHEEVKTLLNSKIPYTSMPKIMGEMVIGEKKSLVICGTHGKTTTTSLLAWAAQCSLVEPGFLIGGIAKNFKRSFHLGGGDLFIIEGDEYDSVCFDKVPKFIHYRPTHVILTSVEFDHIDIYKNLDEVKEAFEMLMAVIAVDGVLIAHGDDKNVCEISCRAHCRKVIYYGIDNGDYTARDIIFNSSGSQFSVFHKERKIDEIKLAMHGKYNILNALAVYILARELAWLGDAVRGSFATFSGVKRRQEVIACENGVTVIEDFAHHPTAVRLTIEAIKKGYPTGHLYCVFEPRSATSRRNVFQEDYFEAFKDAPTALILRTFKEDDISELDRFSSEQLVNDLVAEGVDAIHFDRVDEIIEYLSKKMEPKDVVLLMSNGSFSGIYKRLQNVLENQAPHQKAFLNSAT